MSPTHVGVGQGSTATSLRLAVTMTDVMGKECVTETYGRFCTAVVNQFGVSHVWRGGEGSVYGERAMVGMDRYSP